MHMDSDQALDKMRVNNPALGETRTPMALDDQLSFLLRRSHQRVTGLIDMDPATTQGVISRLVQRGYIQRVPDEVDRRRVQLTLTDIGHQVLLEAMVVGRDIQEKALMGFNEEERSQLSFAAFLFRCA